VTSDVGEWGCRLLLPITINRNARAAVHLHLPGHTLTLVGEVVGGQPTKNEGWTSHSMKFVGRSQAQADALYDALFDLVVPDLSVEPRDASILLRAAHGVARRFKRTFRPRALRSRVALPVQIRALGREWLAITCDVSADGLGLLSHAPLPAGAAIDVAVLAPGGAFTRPAVVTRCVRQTAAPRRFEIWRLGVQLQDEGARDLQRLERWSEAA
jgi:hypothetical protein